jgi:hypothetical protein
VERFTAQKTDYQELLQVREGRGGGKGRREVKR